MNLDFTLEGCVFLKLVKEIRVGGNIDKVEGKHWWADRYAISIINKEEKRKRKRLRSRGS